MTSSTVIPVEMSDTQSETSDKVAKSDSRSFENRSSDVAEDSTSGDGNDTENNVLNESSSASDKTAEVPVEKTEVKDPSKGSNDSKNELEDTSKTGTFSDVNGEGGGETIKEGGDVDQEIDTGDQADHQDQNIEDRSKEAENDDDTKKDRESEQDEVSDGGKNKDENNEGPVEEKLEQNGDKSTPQDFNRNKEGDQPKDTGGNEVFPSGAQSELLNETNTQNGAWSSQAAESKNEKEVQKLSSPDSQNFDSTWKLCNVTTGEDYIPCLDNVAAIKKLHFTGHYEHRERHCPEEPPTCLVPLPEGYRVPVRWPNSREKIPVSRVVLDVGSGVASFGGYLFDRDVLTMSFAPKDEHEAQVQFALERGIPAISAVMDAAWNVPLQACMHKVPLDSASHGRLWPEQWPQRLENVPHWLNNSQPGVYGKPAPEDFVADYEHWKRVVSKSYVGGMGINWSTVRNVMDMRSVYGG
ncbi:hypothetical protein GW17_00036662 [Ensete ventricosum]|nr:hypothetical protein GW17_00036662 [Ensete ventricosum]RZR80695.1 hypothetical protein BHM03_00006767 [Ensete ventricosum]